MSFKKTLPLAVAALAACVTTSCLDEEKQNFGFTVQGYVIQGKTADQTRTYTPFIAVSSNYEEYKLETVSMKNDHTSLPMEPFNDWTFQTVEEQCLFTNADTLLLNGTYTVTAITKTGESQSTQVKINVSEKDTLAAVAPSKLQFTDGTIAVKLPRVQNAQTYGVIITPFEEGKKPERMSALLKSPLSFSLNSDSTEVSYSVQFYRSYLSKEIAGAEVRAYAMGKSRLYCESDTCIIITPTE